MGGGGRGLLSWCTAGDKRAGAAAGGLASRELRTGGLVAKADGWARACAVAAYPDGRRSRPHAQQPFDVVVEAAAPALDPASSEQLEGLLTELHRAKQRAGAVHKGRGAGAEPGWWRAGTGAGGRVQGWARPNQVQGWAMLTKTSPSSSVDEAEQKVRTKQPSQAEQIGCKEGFQARVRR